jgi:hypothetical protein
MMDIQNKIFVIRGMRVMLDVDLAELYGIETKRLNEAVKRNSDRFPPDFAFRLEKQEVINLRSQIATTSKNNYLYYLPYVFTENGVAMLSSVLHSPQAIQVNIAIMRLFTQLRSYLLLESKLDQRISNLEKGTDKMFRIVFERLDALEEAPVEPKKKKIGLKN